MQICCFPQLHPPRFIPLERNQKYITNRAGRITSLFLGTGLKCQLGFLFFSVEVLWTYFHWIFLVRTFYFEWLPCQITFFFKYFMIYVRYDSYFFYVQSGQIHNVWFLKSFTGILNATVTLWVFKDCLFAFLTFFHPQTFTSVWFMLSGVQTFYCQWLLWSVCRTGQ